MTFDDLVATWASTRQLTPAEAVRVRTAVLRTETEEDSERLWDLLRPVTALLDGPRSLSETLSRAYRMGM